MIVMRATAEGLKKARETEKGAIFSKDTNYFTLHFVPFIEDSVKWLYRKSDYPEYIKESQ